MTPRHPLCIAAVVMTAASAAAHPARGFTFRDAEFLPLDRGIAAAQRFVAAELPPGLPLTEARDRLRHADMRCGRTQPGGTVCDFAEVVHVEGGVLGETHWTVRLTADASDRLTSATLDRFVIGAGNPGL